MGDESAAPEESLPLSVEQCIDPVCQSFEAAWKAAGESGTWPRIEDYLAAVGKSERGPLLRELIRVELHYRRQRGESHGPEEYRRRFPGHEALIDAVFGPVSPAVAGAGEGVVGPETAQPPQAKETGENPERTVPPDAPPGDRWAGGGAPDTPAVPGYEVRDLLGQGGMGAVYRAVQCSAGRVVALKVIRPDRLADIPPPLREVWLARFRTEAHAAARIPHDHVVTVYDVGEADGCPYYAMRYVEGRSLAEVLHDGPVPNNRAAAYLEPVARAVHCAHTHDILHRDLKPRNILVDGDERAYVADFGLAKCLEAVREITHTGEWLGTPDYMSPEQARDAAHVTSASDVYSLGATLYALLTGRPPFQAATVAETLHQVKYRDPASPRQLNPAVHRDLETIALKCLHKEPARRYASAEALADDLRRYLRREPIRARPVSRLERGWRWGRRNPVLTGLSAVAALLLVSLLAVPLFEEYGRTDGSLRRVRRAREVRVYVDPTWPPMEFKDGNDLIGFDIDLARALAEELGVEAKFVELDWDWPDVADRLDRHEFDVMISTLTIAKERKGRVDFVEYLEVHTAYVCRAGGPIVRRPGDLAGKRIAVQKGTTAEGEVERLRREGIDIRPDDIKCLRRSEDLFDAVQNGQADVTFADQPVAAFYEKKFPKLIITGSADGLAPPQRIGIALRKQDKELQTAVSQAIEKLKDDGNGAFAKLYKKWRIEPSPEKPRRFRRGKSP
jgi:serine/threonine protein kinase/ABC-type amino acid transport substrate-binding protein